MCGPCFKLKVGKVVVRGVSDRNEMGILIRQMDSKEDTAWGVTVQQERSRREKPLESNSTKLPGKRNEGRPERARGGWQAEGAL